MADPRMGFFGARDPGAAGGLSPAMQALFRSTTNRDPQELGPAAPPSLGGGTAPRMGAPSTAALDKDGETGGGAIGSPALLQFGRAMSEVTELAKNDPKADPQNLAQTVIKRLLADQDPKRSGGLALARMGAAMAASRNPYFLGAAGEGGVAALDEVERQEGRKVKNMVAAAEISGNERRLGVAERKEQAEARLAAFRDRQQTERERATARREELTEARNAARDEGERKRYDLMLRRLEISERRAEEAGRGELEKLLDTVYPDRNDPRRQQAREGALARRTEATTGTIMARIIAKIEREGVDSLTPNERQALEAAQRTDPIDAAVSSALRNSATGGAGTGAASPAPSTASAIPDRPATVPDGSRYNPARRQWLSPSGTLFDARGARVEDSTGVSP